MSGRPIVGALSRPAALLLGLLKRLERTRPAGARPKKIKKYGVLYLIKKPLPELFPCDFFTVHEYAYAVDTGGDPGCKNEASNK